MKDSVCLRYLATGESFSTIRASYRISESSIGRTVNETSAAIWKVLMERRYLKAPESLEEWLIVANTGPPLCFEKWRGHIS